MKVVCPISGIETFHGPYFKNEPAVTMPDAMFFVPIRGLLARARKWKAGEYSETERKLLFLALLDKTELITWELPAQPLPATVQKNMEYAFKIAAWLDIAGAVQNIKSMPKYRVSEHNRDLTNIGYFLHSIEELRTEWMRSSSRRHLEAILEQRQAVLAKLIHSPYRKWTQRDYSIQASWAMDTAEVPKERKEEWTKILSIHTAEEAFLCDKDELLDMRDWLERELTLPGSIGMGSGFSMTQKVLDHIRWLVNLREGGMLAYLGGELGAPANTFSIKVEEVSSANPEMEVLEIETKLVQEGVPLVEPKKDAFKNRLSDYYKARAKWLMHSQLIERLELARKSVETKVGIERLKFAESKGL